MALPQGVKPGTRVTAKRAGWDEDLDPWQYLDMEPLSEKSYDSPDLEGVLDVITGRVPGMGQFDVYLVGGQEADPKTVRPLDTGIENAFCPTGPGGGVDPSCPAVGKVGESHETSVHLHGDLEGRIQAPPIFHHPVRVKIEEQALALLESTDKKTPSLTFRVKHQATVIHSGDRTLGTVVPYEDDRGLGVEVRGPVVHGKNPRVVIMPDTAPHVAEYRLRRVLRLPISKSLRDRQPAKEGVDNSFCPTGLGGGVDPSCSPGGGAAGKSTSTWWAELPLKEKGSVPGVSKGARLKSYAQLGSKDKAAVDSAHKGAATKSPTPQPFSQGMPRATSPPPHDHVKKVLDGVKSVGKGDDKFTSLADLKEHTGLSVGDMHRAVNKLRSDGVLDASALEGRHGATGKEVDSSIREGDRLIGYVSLKG